eukprot:jgi/Botrbrau1/18375/Bobra.0747s0001.1
MPGEIVEVHAEKLVASGQSLLGVIGHLKRNALLSDFKTQNKLLRERKAVLVKEVQNCDAELAALKMDISETLQDLERLYYSCSVKDWELPKEEVPDPQLSELQDLIRSVLAVQ